MTYSETVLFSLSNIDMFCNYNFARNECHIGYSWSSETQTQKNKFCREQITVTAAYIETCSLSNLKYIVNFMYSQ